MKTRTILVALFALLLTVRMSGQDQKSVRFGMLITPQLDWERSGDEKHYMRDGMNGKFGFGLSLEFRVTDVVHFMTGIGGTFSGGGDTYTAGSLPIGYYVDNNQNPVKISDLNNALNNPNPTSQAQFWSSHTAYKLMSRVYKTGYVTVPVALKMMTKPIGPLKYFGIFGGNLEVLTSSKATDQVEDGKGTIYTITDTDVKNDCNLFKVSLNVGAGAEYTLSGTTALTFGINYYRAFTSTTSDPSNYLIVGSSASAPNNGFNPAQNSGGYTASSHSLFGDGLALTIGILF